MKTSNYGGCASGVALILALFMVSGCVASNPWAKKIISPPEKQRPAIPSIERDKDPLRPAAPDEEAAQPSERSGQELLPDYGRQVPAGEQRVPQKALDAEVLQGSVAEEELAQKAGDASARHRESAPVYKIDEAFVDQRLQLYSEKIGKWNEAAGEMIRLDQGDSWPEGWYDCVQQTEMLLSGYRRVKTGLQQKVFRASLDPWGLLAKDIKYIESQCDELFAKNMAGFSDDISAYALQLSSEAGGMVERYYKLGKYAEAVSVYEAQAGIDSRFPDDARLKDMYVGSLLRLGRVEEVIQVLAERDAANGPIVSKDFFADALQYANVLFVAGQYEGAAKVYDRIKAQLGLLGTDEEWVYDQQEILANTRKDLLEQYRRVLEAYYASDRTSVPEEIYRGYRVIEKENQSAMLVSVRKLLHELEAAVEAHANEQLLRAKDLMEEKEFAQARAIIQQLKGRGTDLIVENAQLLLAEIDEAERVENLSLKQLQQQKIKNQWQKAVHLYEIKEYDEAIAEFSQLLNTEYQSEARTKIAEASSFAATEMRRRAASLFVKARKAADPGEKVQLLRSSKMVLLDLLAKYPDTGIVGKVQQNIQVLDEELAKYASPELEPAVPAENTLPVESY